VEEQSQIEIDDNAESFHVVQTLWVTPLGPNRFRLEQTPFPSNIDAWFHDIIEATRQEDGRYLFCGMVERSTWKMYDFGLMNTPVESDPFMTTLGETVEGAGGVFEMVAGCFLVHLPIECDLDLMKEAARIAKTLNLPIPKIFNELA
jgi:hypothetical protein